MTSEQMITEAPSELAMETQTFAKKKKQRYNKIHVWLIVFIALQVLFLFTFSEPMTILWGGEPIFNLYNDDIMARTARIIMIYHALANPFLVANTFWIMEYYEVREKFIPALKLLLVPGAVISGTCGLVFAYTRWRFFHEMFYFGLFLIFAGGVLFMVAGFPIPGKFPKHENEVEGSTFRRLNLENYSMIVLAFCVIVSTVYAGLAAFENFTNEIWMLNRPTDAFLAEETVRILHHDIVEEFIVSHLHIQLALCSAMVVMVGYKTSEIKGKIYNVICWVNPVGVFVISYGAWVLNHYLIWVGAGLLILNTVAMSLKGWWKISQDHYGEKFSTLSKGKKLRGVFSDSVKFSLYFIYMYAQIVVTICGIIVGLQTREVYRSHEYVQVEYDFNVGHWHLLAVLLATLLILTAIDHFEKQGGLLRRISGYFLGIGGFIAFSGGNLYLLRSPYVDPLPSMYTTFVGVWILTIGFFLGILTIVRAHRRNLKKGGN